MTLQYIIAGRSRGRTSMITRIAQPKSDFMKREPKNPFPSNVKTLMYLLDVLLLGTYGNNNNNNNNNFKNLLYMMSPLCHACKKQS
jgi:hypothetical protein